MTPLEAIAARRDAFLRAGRLAVRDLADLLRAAREAEDHHAVILVLRHAGELAEAMGRPLPRGVLLLAVRALLAAGEVGAAREWHRRGLAAHPDFPAWAELAQPGPEPWRAAIRKFRGLAGPEGLPQARALLEEWLRAPRPDWVAIALAADALGDALAVLRAEEALGMALHESIPPGLPHGLPRAGFRARMRLRLHGEALALAGLICAAPPEAAGQAAGEAANPWRRLRLRAQLAQGAAEAALPEALALLEGGEAAALPLVTDALLALEETERLAALLDALEERWPAEERMRLLEARLRRAAHAGNLGETVALLRRAEAEPGAEGRLLPLRIAASRRLGDLPALQALAERLEAERTVPERRAEWLMAGPRLIGALHGLSLDWARIEELARWLAAQPDLPEAGAAVLAHVMGEAGLAGESLALLRRALSLHPRSPGLWGALVRHHLLRGELREAAEAKAALCREAPERLRPHLVARIDPRAWDRGDVVSVLRLAAEDGANGRALAMLTCCTALRAGEAEAILREHPLPPRLGAQLTLLGQRAADMGRLEQAVLSPLPFSAFEESLARSRARLAPLLERLAAEGAPGPGGLRAGLEGLEHLAARPGALLHTAESYAEALGLARFLIERIRARIPSSVLRLGDGEGLFLPCAVEGLGDLSAAQELLRKTWWGARQPAPEAFAAMVRDHEAAVAAADVVGAMPLWRLLNTFPEKGPPVGNWQGILNAIGHAARRLRPEAIVTSAHLHHDLRQWNLWREILGEVEEASWICCHDLGPLLHEQWGVRTRIGLRIPGEARYFGSTGRYARGEAPEETLADRHEAVRAALAPRPGELWLVAAGFLGKIYCDDIRRRGGIALDIGSLADYWLGFATRRYGLAHGVSTTLTNTLVTGAPITPPRDERARMLGPAGPVRSTRSGRWNIGGAAPPAERRMFLQVIGHPRCASGFMASLFNRHGLEIGHERLLRDGISSWMNVVRDAQAPYGDNGAFGLRYDHTVIHARNPVDAIPSIMLENGVERSFDFRRQHILRETGEDIAAHPCAVARAVASYVGWYEIALRVEGARLIRVEEAEEEVPRFLAGLRPALEAWRGGRGAVTAPLAPAREAEPEDMAPEEDEEEAGPVNPSIRKFSQPKPSLGPEDFARLEPGLMARFLALVERLGYATARFTGARE